MNETLESRRANLLKHHPRWQPRTLAGFLQEAAAAFPDRPFVITGQCAYNYAQIDAWSLRLARGLMACGAEAGDHIALVMANHPEFVALKFAIARIGCIAVPMNFLLRKDEMKYVIRQSDCSMLITMERFRDLDYLRMLDEVDPGWDTQTASTVFPKLRSIVTFDAAGPTRHTVRCLADIEAAATQVSENAVVAREAAARPGDVADIVYTSGTTGVSKGAMLTHDNVLISAYSSALIRALGDGHRTLFALPLYHVFAYVEGLLAVMWVGGAVIPQLVFDPRDTFDAIARFGAQELLLVPTMTTALVEHPERSNYDLHTLRTVMSAAAPAPIKLWELVRKELGVTEIVTAYGQTETSASSTYTMPDDPLELVSTTVGRAKPGGPAGRDELGVDPMLGPLVTEYKTVDPTTGQDLPAGMEGELAIRGPEVMQGYYNKPAETAAVFGPGGWMRSGDLGRIRDNGYVQLTGRSKELYKCGGELVAPKEIEELLSARNDVEQAYVVGLPDDRMGEIGCAFVIPRAGSALEPDEVIGYCRERLARFKVPAHVLLINRAELPQTATGKVQKFRLVERQAHSRHPLNKDPTMTDTVNVSEPSPSGHVLQERERIRAGGRPERKEELRARGKWLARDRLKYLLDPGFTIEDWILARCDNPELPADGVVTAIGAINGRKVCVMANDMSVKAGTWGQKTVYKIQRIQEVALEYGMPIIYLVDSGGARIDEQFGLYLDRSHSGRIFWNMARMNGAVPQVCINFGPSPAGAAYLPAFCDFVIMIEGQTSVFLGSPRQAAAATGEQVTAEEMGGARMHCTQSGLGDLLVKSEEEALDAAKKYLSYLPDSWRGKPPDAPPCEPASHADIDTLVPNNERRAFNIRKLIDVLIDAGSLFEIKKDYAGELITCFARIGGIAVGVMANQSMVRGGILMQDSSEKGAQFVSTCSAFNLPMVFLMDVPGFMISSQCERAAIVRRGQKMLQAVAEATQPRICVIVRKGYGAGYMAMSGATFQPDCTIALPQAKLGLMGPAAAIQAIYGRKIKGMGDEEKSEFVHEKQDEYSKGLGVWGPAAEMYIDDIVPGSELRQQLIARLEVYRRRERKPLVERHNNIMRG